MLQACGEGLQKLSGNSACMTLWECAYPGVASIRQSSSLYRRKPGIDVAGDRLIGGGGDLGCSLTVVSAVDLCLVSLTRGGYPDTYPKIISVPIHLQVCPLQVPP